MDQQRPRPDRIPPASRGASRQGHNAPPSALDPGEAVDAAARHVRTITHEMLSLIDGSMRYLDLAQRCVAGTPNAEPFTQREKLERHLRSAHAGLGHLAELVRDAETSTAALARGEPAGAIDHPRPLRQAIEHAAESLAPLAEGAGVRLELELDPSIDDAPPAPVFAALRNILRNAIEALAPDGAPAPAGARVLLRASAALAPGDEAARSVTIDVLDNGPGPDAAARTRAFEFGFTTKRRGAGVGLSLARDILADIGGTIDLLPNSDAAFGGRGAHARITYRTSGRPWGGEVRS